jgi:hypothetical protein
MKQIFRNRYFNVNLYWRGIVIGVYSDNNDEVEIILPFVVIQVHIYQFRKFPKTNTKLNEL